MDSSKKPAVFLDRDGVLTVEQSYVCNLNEMIVFAYAADCVAKIKEKGYYAIVITNQSGIARGLFTEDTLLNMNDYLKKMTGVDEVYFCPHHPEGKIERYRHRCSCRKPKIGLINQACRDFNIDLNHSYFVGDRATDVLTGQNAGISTILLESGYGSKNLEMDVCPDFVLQDLRMVADVIK